MIKIALDLDDTILDFINFYKQYFPRDIDMISKNITKYQLGKIFQELRTHPNI